MALIFDTETNGLPVCKSYGVYYSYKKSSKYNNSRLVQISYIIMDENFNKLEESDTIIKRDSFEINNSQFHGITNERSDNEGIVFEEFVKLFHNSLDQVQTVVAHNLEFDINVLCAELYRYNFLDTIAKVLSKKQICTMKLTKNLVRAKFKNSEDIKDPSLKELYHFATGEELQNQHNSIYDVVNLYKVLKKLKLNIF